MTDPVRPPARPINPYNLGIVGALHAAAAVALWWYVTRVGFAPVDVVAALAAWFLTGTGITAGYHRLLSHKGYHAHRGVEIVLTLLGGAAAQNSALAWSADHRRHHRDVDTERDPYNARRGFWWSHVGWVFRQDPYDRGISAEVPDLEKDAFLRFQHRFYLPVAALTNLAIVALMGALTGRWMAALLISGFVRVVLVQHATFTINSLSHMWGSRPWSHANTSRDNWALSLLTMGEGYHNYHHAFAADYRNGVAWYAYDPTKWLIWTLSKVGLAWDLRRTPDDVVLRRRYEERKASVPSRLELALDRWMAEAKAKPAAMLAKVDLLGEQLEQQQLAMAEQVDAFRKHLRGRADDLQSQLVAQRDELRAQWQARVDDAARSLEAALHELKERRQALAARMRELAEATSDDMRAKLKAEARALRHKVAESKRAARHALVRFEQAVEGVGAFAPV